MHREILESAGFPGRAFGVDFETYYDPEFSLTKLSYSEYILDPRFEVTAVSIREYGTERKWYADGPRVEALLRRFVEASGGSSLDGITFVAHNAPFDAAILAWYYRYTPKYMVCTKALASAWDARSSTRLADLAEKHEWSAKGDTSSFLRHTFQAERGGDSVVYDAESRRSLYEYTARDTEIGERVFAHYLPLLTNVKDELRVMSETIRMSLCPTIRIDKESADKLIEQMNGELTRELNTVGLSIKEVRAESFDDRLCEALKNSGDDPDAYKKKAKNAKGWKMAIAASDSERKVLEQHADSRVRNLISAKNAASSWPNHISRVNNLLVQSSYHEGKLPVLLNYHGAHTGRWTGGGGINPQNFGSKSHPLVNEVRHLLVPPEGYRFVIVDASQIEARVLAWVAGQDDLVDVFARGDDVYCYMASKIVGYEVRPVLESDSPEVVIRLKEARGKGKVAVLGGGYGCGEDKFSAMYGLPLEEASEIVTYYRQSNSKIVRYWYDVEKAMRRCVVRGVRTQLGKGVCVLRDAGVPCIRLPSGRMLRYPRIRVRNDSLEQYDARVKKWKRTWGGVFVENICQAIARDILASSLLEVKDTYPVVLHAHDELVCIAPENSSNEANEHVVQVMSTTPDWADGLPLAAEGRVAERYEK